MKKLILSTLMILSVQASTALADQRYDVMCVTSENAPGKVLVYNTLVSTYASEYNYEALTYLREADVFTVNKEMAKNASLDLIEKNRTHKTEYKNADFPSSWDEKRLRSVSGGRVVIATSQIITITDSKNHQIQFKMPFVDPDLTATGEVKRSDLIFNGQTVSSVNYRICGSGQD